MKHHLPGLNRDAPNYAWSFELIAPENGVLFADATGVVVEVPFPLITRSHPNEVIGPDHLVFDDEFPVRFDFLDTVAGDGLSVQCHPLPRYIWD